MKIERIKIKDKEVEFDKKDQVVCVINNMPYDEIKDFIIFDNERKGDFDSDLGCFLQKDHFFGVKLDDNKKTIMLSIAESYFKEISPIELSGGKKIYFIYDPDDVFVDFDIKLFNKDSVELDYYEERENSLTLKLIEFIVVNNVISRWCKNFSIDFNFPIFISDGFDYIEHENIERIMGLIKTMDKQAFISLTVKNKKIESFCDKVVER